ncbi:hypothetical protein B0H67DRAFT_362255 [Lasiosphaeris hirsuta]|uniref:Uncharacterized protein n=1 Tax=Lasiosphaeris hirsuta TaxID=260670 RepID=A0AA39ZWD7_9PEZI|nr:hypothetical protein B0H67DRAFT_362255 [Lasiosphaeris hirsuta]
MIPAKNQRYPYSDPWRRIATRLGVMRRGCRAVELQIAMRCCRREQAEFRPRVCLLWGSCSAPDSDDGCQGALRQSYFILSQDPRYYHGLR